MNLHDNVTLGVACLALAATVLVTIAVTSLIIHLRHREIRERYRRIQRWAAIPPQLRALPALPIDDEDEEDDDPPPAPVIQAWWTASAQDLTETAVLPRMTDDILTAEALRFEVTQVLQTVAWRPARDAAPGRGHLDMVDGYAGAGRHRAGPQ